MTEHSCNSISELLVAYSDAELPQRDAERVAAHLARCLRCRLELRRLERSLEAAKAIWRDSAARAPVAGIPRIRRFGRSVVAPAWGAAAAAALLLTLGLWAVFHKRPAGESAQVEPTPSVEEVELEQLDVEAMIAREARAARLAASAQLLAGQPGLEEYRDQAQRYLAETFGGPTGSHPRQTSIGNREPAIQ